MNKTQNSKSYFWGYLSPLIRHTHKRLFLCHWDIFSGTHEAFVFIKCSMIAPGR
jgi:hypothetical protein